MKYNEVYIESLGYELPPFVLTSAEIEDRLADLYAALHFKKGQLEALTGIEERRYWAPGTKVSTVAAKAAQKALAKTSLPIDKIGMLIFGGVTRDHLEPATACAVAHQLGLNANTIIYDTSNACLGVLNGMVQAANAIELGQIEAALVVSGETSKQIMDFTMERLLREPNLDIFRKTVATLTGGSGAAAVLLTNTTLNTSGHKFLGGMQKSAPEYHTLCVWGPPDGEPAGSYHKMETDSVGVMNNGVALGVRTFEAFRNELGWGVNQPDKLICHQVGVAHQKHILNSIGISPAKDFTTFRYLGNIGTVSLPITAAIAEERGFLQKDDLVGFLGIGSGLNCMMLGLKW